MDKGKLLCLLFGVFGLAAGIELVEDLNPYGGLLDGESTSGFAIDNVLFVCTRNPFTDRYELLILGSGTKTIIQTFAGRCKEWTMCAGAIYFTAQPLEGIGEHLFFINTQTLMVDELPLQVDSSAIYFSENPKNLFCSIWYGTLTIEHLWLSAEHQNQPRLHRITHQGRDKVVKLYDIKEPSQFTQIGGRVYMIGHAPVTGSGSDIFPCSADVDTNCYDKVQNILSPTLLYAAGTTLYFTAKETGSDTLGWRMEMGDNPKIFGEEFIHGLEFNNAFYFILRDNPELHKIDPTLQQAHNFSSQMCTPSCSSVALQHAKASNKLYFTSTFETDVIVWKHPGLDQFERLITIENIDGPFKADTVSFLSSVGNTIVFGTRDAIYTYTESAGLSENESANREFANSRFLAKTADSLYFTSGSYEMVVWKIGESSEPVLFSRVFDEPWKSSNPGKFSSLGDQYIFIASDPVHGVQLWTSNYNNSGPQPITNVVVPNTVEEFVTVPSSGAVLYTVSASSDTHKGIFYHIDSNGTETELMKSQTEIMYLTRVNDVVFFVASEPEYGVELYTWTESDGIHVKDLNTGNPSSNPTNLVQWRNWMFCGSYATGKTYGTDGQSVTTMGGGVGSMFIPTSNYMYFFTLSKLFATNVSHVFTVGSTELPYGAHGVTSWKDEIFFVSAGVLPRVIRASVSSVSFVTSGVDSPEEVSLAVWDNKLYIFEPNQIRVCKLLEGSSCDLTIEPHNNTNIQWMKPLSDALYFASEGLLYKIDNNTDSVQLIENVTNVQDPVTVGDSLLLSAAMHPHGNEWMIVPGGCSDGFKSVNEQCDDGNLNSGDGCAADCTVEAGWECQFINSVCNPICGDGIVIAPEECDSKTPGCVNCKIGPSATDITANSTTGTVTTGEGEITTMGETSAMNNSEDENQTDSNDILPIALGAGIGGAVLLGLCVLAAVLIAKRRKNRREPVNSSPDPSPNSSKRSTEVELQRISSSSQLLLGNVTKLHRLGGGNFGDVYLGEWSNTKVALKQLKEENQTEEFEREAATLAKLRHPNIVHYYGIHKAADGCQFIVLEYLSKGALLDVLRHEDATLKTVDLIDMGLCAASGMSYLEEQNVLHRDLSARNLLVTKVDDKYVVKVSDFGLSRQTENNQYTPSTSKIPIRWTSPEVLGGKPYTSKADVWSYGVTLWEIFTCGAMPYSWLSNAEVVDEVPRGNAKLSKPDKATPEIYQVIVSCTSLSAQQRPNFAEICTTLKSIQQSLFMAQVPMMTDKIPLEEESGDIYHSTNEVEYQTSPTNFK